MEGDDGMDSLDPELQRFIRSTDDEIFGADGGPDGGVDDEDVEEDAFDEDDDDGRGKAYHMEFRQHKREYYISKMKYQKVIVNQKNGSVACSELRTGPI